MNAPRDTRAPHSPDGPWELIGPADCPIMWRRTIVANRFGKILVHRFLPNASDKDPHDHPSSFLTIVLRGGYDDEQPCRCREPLVYVETGHRTRDGVCVEKVVDEVRAPTIRFRPAEHTHITRVHADGALTLVIMFRKRRSWGFWRDGHWYPWRRYEKIFGLNWRCDE